MKNDFYRLSSYVFNSNDSILFDANIWLYIYGPQGNPLDYKAQVYSGALAKALKANSQLYIDLLVLGEVINRYARLRYNLLMNAGQAVNDFKRFRNSLEFKPVAKEIAASAKRILSHCKRISSRFETVDIVALVNEYEAGNVDFNDQVIAELCKAEGLKLVTHDSDFTHGGITVITANNRLLS